MKKQPESKQEKLINPGTIWQLGNHRLAYGDCRDKDLVNRLFGKEKIDLICSDPPYGVAVVESKRGFKTLAKNKIIMNDQIQSNDEYRKFSKEWLDAIVLHLAKRNASYIFNADKMVWSLREGMIDAGFKVSQLLVWVKSQSVLGRLDYAPQHELILYGWHGVHDFHRSKDKSVIFYPRPQKNLLHPTVKPIGLIRRLILNSSEIGDVVYDGFLGSGTALLACEQTKRRCFAVEMDLEYCLTSWIADSMEEQERFFGFPFEILRGDFVGFTAVTDPFWPKLDRFLWHFLETVSPIAKLVTCVTKWPLERDTMKRLARIENFCLVVGITGNHPPVEKITVRQHLDTLRLAKEEGVSALPISHPYIAELSDLSFLPELYKLGYNEFDVKGLRYCDAQMASWMPERSRRHYLGRETEEVLPEDGWRNVVADSGFSLLSPREWYLREGLYRSPRLSREEAAENVEAVLRIANVVSSADRNTVYDSAIERRL